MALSYGRWIERVLVLMGLADHRTVGKIYVKCKFEGITLLWHILTIPKGGPVLWIREVLLEIVNLNRNGK